jgi:hypothetical protein
MFAVLTEMAPNELEVLRARIVSGLAEGGGGKGRRLAGPQAVF